MHTVGSHLSELQLSEHFSYQNTFSKATPTTSDNFCVQEPVTVQIADIECFRAHSTHYMAAEDTG